jgi:2EXR family
MGLRTFTLFNQLPREIREAIWLYAMTPATVYIKPSWREYKARPRKQENPVLLQVRPESRAIALERYELVSDIDKIYVNFDLDTVYIDSNDYLIPLVDPFCSRMNEAKFQYLTVAVDWLEGFKMEVLVNKVSRCESLRQLTLVFGIVTDREQKANLSTHLARYKDMTKDQLLATLEDKHFLNNNYSPSFDEFCEGIYAGWLCIALDEFPHKDKWPEIIVITRPAITRTRKSLKDNVGSSN